MRIHKVPDATPEEMAEAVKAMNDWSGGQFYILEEDSFPGIDYAYRLLRQALLAFEYRYDDLTDYATQVCRRLIEELPALIRTQEHESRQRNRPKREPSLNPQSKTPGYVYLLQSPTSAFKIGRTKNPGDRLRTFSVKLPFEVEFTCLIQTDDMYGLERDLHQRFADKRVGGEWFALDASDIEYIKSLEAST